MSTEDAASAPPPGGVDAFTVFRTVFEMAPSDRGSCLDALCGADPALRREVEELLRYHDAPATALRDRTTRVLPELAPTPDAPATSPVPLQKAWRLRRLLVGALALLGCGALLVVVHRGRTRVAYEHAIAAATATIEREPLVCRDHLEAAPIALRDVRWALLRRQLDPVVARYHCTDEAPDGDVAFDGDGAPRFAFALGNLLRVVDVERAYSVVEVRAAAAVRLPALSADANMVAAWVETGADTFTVAVWDVRTGYLLRKRTVAEAEPTRLAFDPSSRRLAWSARGRGNVRGRVQGRGNVLDLTTGNLTLVGAASAAGLPSFADGGDALWVGTVCHPLAATRLRTKAPSMAEWAWASPTGTWRLAGIVEHKIWLARADDPALGQPLVEAAAAPQALAFSADEQVLALALGDLLVVHDLNAGGVRTLVHAASRLALDARGGRLLLVDRRGAALLDVDQRASAR